MNAPVIGTKGNVSADTTLRTQDAYHRDQANAEGWGVFAAGVDEDGFPQMEIRCVVVGAGYPRFPDDLAALRHVLHRAGEGSFLHLGALRLVQPLEATTLPALADIGSDAMDDPAGWLCAARFLAWAQKRGQHQPLQ